MTSTVEPVYYEHLGTNKKYPDYQGVLIFQVSLYDKASFGTITKCVDYAGIVLPFRLFTIYGCALPFKDSANGEAIVCLQKQMVKYTLGSLKMT